MEDMDEDQMYEQMYEQQMEDQMIDQQMEDQMIDQQMEDQMIEQQMEDQMIEQQMEDQMIDQQMEDQMMYGFTKAQISESELSILNGLISPTHHQRKGQYEFYAFTSYLPVRFEANPEEKLLNRIVYSFKSGSEIVSNRIANLVMEFINNNFNNLTDKILMVIPASTKQKNSARFENFVNIICKGTKVNNGVTGITIIEDRTELKGKTGISKVNNLLFNPDIFRGKHVILFDDVITSGQSFLQISDILINKGAKKVTGLFFAKTVHK